MQGVDKPLPSIGNHHPSTEAHDDEITDNTPVPYHKQALLNLVTNLHIVHASSSIPLTVDDCYLVMPSYESCTVITLEECRADRLGKMDLDGYILADDITRRMEPDHPTFNRLKTLALGVWDDGRWKTYVTRYCIAGAAANQSILDSDDKETRLAHIFRRPPIYYVEDILKRTFHDARSHLACSRPNPIFETMWAHPIKGRGLTIRHEPDLRSGDPYSSVPSRFYVTTETFGTIDFGEFFMRRFPVGYLCPRNPVFFIPLHRYQDDLGAPDLELCISPKTQGDEGQLRLAREIKEALETFRQRNKKYAKKHLQKFRILVGDEIPPCPCCGSKT